MNIPKLIIFDWDGTLVDSIGRIIDCFVNTYDFFNLEIPSHRAIRKTIGLPLSEGFEVLGLGLESPGTVALAQKYRDFWFASKQLSSPAFPFCFSLCHRLHQAGHIMAVATGKSRAGLNREIHDHQVASFLKATVCGDESAAKPDPDMLLRILEETGIQASDALMIGDSPLDLEMANQAGIPAVGVLSGSGDRAELEAKNPLAVLEDAGSLDKLWAPTSV